MKTINTITLSFILMLFINSSVASKTIYEQNIELAHAGDPIAQYNLGYMFQQGEGVLQDYKKAVE